MMKRQRRILNLLLALTLLVQGMGAATAIWAQSDTPAAAVSASDNLPCHGAGGAAPNRPAPACCDDACPSLLSCALAHHTLIARAPLPIFLQAARPDAVAVPVPITQATDPLFRPPITRQA